MSLNSQMFHIVINGCQDVLIQGVKVIAAGNSPNTDGIHVQFSKNVAIFDTSIKTGDDCVSIGPGTKDLWMERIFCGPGHGIRYVKVCMYYTCKHYVHIHWRLHCFYSVWKYQGNEFYFLKWAFKTEYNGSFWLRPLMLMLANVCSCVVIAALGAWPKIW